MKLHAYLSELNQAAAASSMTPARGSGADAPAGSLHDRFVQWYAALPTLARNRPFAMVEIERALGTRGRLISAVLIRLGWRRQRIWTGAGPFHRYWLPPSVAAVASERPCCTAGQMADTLRRLGAGPSA